jgi:hypothetical protein
MDKRLYAPLLAALLLSACVVAPDHGYVVAPALPVAVELEVVPYYYGGVLLLPPPRSQLELFAFEVGPLARAAAGALSEGDQVQGTQAGA